MTNATGLDCRLLSGLVLAGGEGRRLQSYVQQLRGEALPKQYVNFVGRRSMLEHTFHRAEKLIPEEQILTVVSRQHLAHAVVRRQLAARPKETLIVQPANKETGPGILLPLMFIYKRCPEAIVALFPSDHFILEEDRFMSHVRLAAQAVNHEPTRIVLLAIEPHEPETDYGYVLPHKDAGRPCRVGTRAVSAFVEKPGVDMTFELMMGGGLWNTMTMVFKLDTLLELVRRVHPALYLNFSRILEAVGTVEEQTTVDDVYERAGAGQLFKRDHDEDCRSPSAIALSPSRAEGFWSDWGSREHVLQAFRRLDQVHSEETQTDFREQKPGNGTQRAMASQPSLGYRSKAFDSPSAGYGVNQWVIPVE